MSHSGFAVPIEERYFEDYIVGSVHDCGTFTVDEHEMIDFATRYDPQPFHVDPVAAQQTPFGGLIASGWHTTVLMMRQYVDHYLSHVASLASPGGDELRWLKPVRPGDMLTVRATVLEAKRSRSKPDRGIVRTLCEVINQYGELVMSLKAVNFLRCRSAPPAPEAR
jgi:acyl dehydratase